MVLNEEYKNWINSLKEKIRSTQIKASLSVNEHLILLYWEIGKSIVEKQLKFDWGSKIVEQMAKDLKRELPDTNGFSRTNLFAMRKFYKFYRDFASLTTNPFLENKQQNKMELVHQLGGQLEPTSILCKIPWKHHVTIMGLCSEEREVNFYLQQIITHN
jgi:predicted nuclease of restriction endonuclease-like (RecB) superfamily